MAIFSKICGITQVTDAQAVVQAGADAIGLVFYPSSPRHVNLTMAKKISQAVAGKLKLVALVVNASAADVKAIITQLPIDILQFHGDEPAAFCEQFGLPYWKAINVQSAEDVINAEANYPSASALLLDAHHATLRGGSGKTVNWQIIPTINTPIILAGGLNPDNVSDAIQQVQPFGVDVSSGVEKIKGYKDPVKILRFMQVVREVDP